MKVCENWSVAALLSGDFAFWLEMARFNIQSINFYETKPSFFQQKFALGRSCQVDFPLTSEHSCCYYHIRITNQSELPIAGVPFNECALETAAILMLTMSLEYWKR